MTRILMTNLYLAHRSGSEIATAELALALGRRGHQIAVFAPMLGPLAHSLREAGIVVVDDATKVPFRPDIIHAHHSPATAAALAAHPGVPAVFVSHGAIYWVERPPKLSRIVRCFAVTEWARELAQVALPHLGGNVELLLNAVDLDRFQPRPPLPARPSRALILTKNAGHIPMVAAAAQAEGLTGEALGPGVGKEVDDLPRLLPDYDIVFATGRTALEAAAVGAAVVLVDEAGLAGMMTSEVLEAWRNAGFGLRLQNRPVTVEALRGEIARYDAADAAAVSASLRAVAGLETLAVRVEGIHAEVLAEARTRPPADPRLELGELAAYLTVLTQEFAPAITAGARAGELSQIVLRQDRELAEAARTIAELQARIEDLTRAAESARRPWRERIGAGLMRLGGRSSG